MIQTGEQTKEDKQKLLDLLQVIDYELPWLDFFKAHGLELLTQFFKATKYGPKAKFSISNQPPSEIRVENTVGFQGQDDKLNLDSKINYLVNNLI